MTRILCCERCYGLHKNAVLDKTDYHDQCDCGCHLPEMWENLQPGYRRIIEVKE